MTLYELVIDGGFVLSFVLITLLGLMWPTRPPRCVLCLKERQDEQCTPVCLRTCRVMRNASAVGARALVALPVLLNDLLDELVEEAGLLSLC